MPGITPRLFLFYSAIPEGVNVPLLEAALDNANIREWFEGLPEVAAPKAYEIAVPAAVSNTSGQVVTPLDVLPGSGGQTLVRLSDGAIQNVSDTAFPDPRIQAVYQTAGQFGNTDIANAYVYNYDGYTDPGIYTQEFQSISQGAQDGLSFEDSVNGLPAAKQGGITEEVQQKIYDDVTDAFQAGRQTSYQASIPQSFAQGTASNGTTTVNVPTSHTVSPETGTGSTQNPLETVDGMGDNGYNGEKGISDSTGKFNFNKYLKDKIGDPPTDMVDPHAHHILFKEGHGEAQKALVREGQELLGRYGIDPIYGLENLIWAPNRVAGQHGIEALRGVVEQLKMVEDFGGTNKYIRNKLMKRLLELGKLAARRR